MSEHNEEPDILHRRHLEHQQIAEVTGWTVEAIKRWEHAQETEVWLLDGKVGFWQDNHFRELNKEDYV